MTSRRVAVAEFSSAATHSSYRYRCHSHRGKASIRTRFPYRAFGRRGTVLIAVVVGGHDESVTTGSGWPATEKPRRIATSPHLSVIGFYLCFRYMILKGLSETSTVLFSWVIIFNLGIKWQGYPVLCFFFYRTSRSKTSQRPFRRVFPYFLITSPIAESFPYFFPFHIIYLNGKISE